MSAVPVERTHERYNFIGLDCPHCMRAKSLRIVAGLYECRGCSARFKFFPETTERLATLERVREAGFTAYNRGARLADDCFCQGCGKRGIVGRCPRCQL